MNVQVDTQLGRFWRGEERGNLIGRGERGLNIMVSRLGAEDVRIGLRVG